MNTHNRFHVFHHFSLSVNHFLKNNSNSSHTQKTYEEPETTGISASCFPSVHYCRADYIICGTHWVSQNENTALPFCQWFRVSRWRQQSIKPITGPFSKLGPVSHPRGASLSSGTLMVFYPSPVDVSNSYFPWSHPSLPLPVLATTWLTGQDHIYSLTLPLSSDGKNQRR